MLSLIVCQSSSVQADRPGGPVPKPGDPQDIAQTVPASTSDKRQLTPEQHVSASIGGGEKHSYEINLSGGDYARFTLGKGDLNLTMSIAAPDGKGILDISHFPRVRETFSITAPLSGSYVLTIRSLEKPGYGGLYDLVADQPRPSRPNDAVLLPAERSLQAADRLRMAWKADSFAASIAKYREAQNQFRQAGDLRGETLAELGGADVFFELSELHKALAAYKVAFELATRARNAGLQVQALNGIAYVLIDLGEFQASLDYSTRAGYLSRQAGDRVGLAASTNLVGLYHLSTHNLLKALQVLGEALSLFQEIGDRRGQAETLANLGYTRQDFGDPPPALDSFEKSLGLATDIGDQRIQSLDLTAIALVNSVLGQKQKALGLHNQALKALQAMGNRFGEAVVNNGMADVYSDTGANELALHHHIRALQLFKAIGEAEFVGLTSGLVGNDYLALGNQKQALVWCMRRLVDARARGNDWLAAHTLNDIGRVYDSMDQTATALDYYNRALAKEKDLKDRRGQAESLSAIGFVNERRGQTVVALERYRNALALSREVEHGEGVIQALDNIARVKRDNGDLPGAYEAACSVVDLLEKQRAKVAGSEFRTTYFAAAHEQYQLYIDLLMRMHREHPSDGYDTAALEASEKAHARGLLDMLRETRADIREGVRAELLARERKLRDTLDAKAAGYTTFLNKKLGQQEIAAFKNDLTELTAEYEALEAQIRAESPRYAALTQPGALSLAEIRKQILDPDTVLLEYSLGKERSYLWAVTADSVRAYELPARGKVEAAAKALYKWAASPEQPGQPHRVNRAHGARSPALELSNMILAPAAASLKSKRLVIVADGPLQYVPFSTLIDPAAEPKEAQPLVLDHEIVNLPSASVLAELRREPSGRPAASKTLAVFADPVFDSYDSRLTSNQPAKRGGSATRSAAQNCQFASAPGSQKVRRSRSHPGITRGFLPGGRGNQNGPLRFQRLSFAKREAEAIAALVPADDSRVLLNFDATKAAVLDQDIGRYRIIHFATHALLDNSHPEFTWIVLSRVDRQGREVDGFLRLNDIYNMKLGAGLVVLSACETALGKPVEGEGLLGLTRGFMYAGAPRVVASLWEVDDKATGELMKKFYEGMFVRRLTAAAALRAAQDAIRREPQWRSPYYWAGFVLQGDWR
ncbi:MAG TPA: CHAT domain-containing protein [Blastocatellia bacterium]|nr:CHAT domain-containing protein [Blastocatellia bacterium]